MQAVLIGDKGTENFKDFITRNCDCCDMIEREYKGKNILIVTHAANARIVNYYFTGKSNKYDFSKAVARNFLKKYFYKFVKVLFFAYCLIEP